MQTKLIRLLNDLGPDLELEVSAGRSSVGDSGNQMNLSVKGKGRYPEILNFLHRVETYRPIILVESMSLSAPKPKQSNRSGNKAKKSQTEKTKDPSMSFRMSIQLYTRAGEEGGA